MKNKFILICLGILFLGCNASEDGFNAPDGSTVEFLSDSVTIQFASASSGEALVLVDLKVIVPIGDDLEVANEITGSISCLACNLYVFKPGVSEYLAELSLLDYAGQSFGFTTNNRGLYTFVVGVLPPGVDSSGDLLSYTDGVNASIGVDVDQFTVTAEGQD